MEKNLFYRQNYLQDYIIGQKVRLQRMISEELKKDYLNWAETVISELGQNKKEWVKKFQGYAEVIKNNKEEIERLRRRFYRRYRLYYYLNVSQIKKGKEFDIRFLGQSVGTVIVENDNVYLTVSDKQASNSRKFGYDEEKIGKINKSAWLSKEAKNFRAFFKNCDKGLNGKECMVESALYSELEKIKSENKTLCNIKPISYAGVRFHLPTPLRACDSKENKIFISKDGRGVGGIDLLCRRRTGSKANIVVIEIKNGNKSDESFDKTMKQAISYALFIRELIHSDAGEFWMEIFRMKKQMTVAKDKKQGYTIDCVVAMPKGITKPSYCGDVLSFDNGDGTVDRLVLHYIEITSDTTCPTSEDVKFETSFKK